MQGRGSDTCGSGSSLCCLQQIYIRGFHVGDARVGGVRIFDARVKIQHDAQWRPIMHF